MKKHPKPPRASASRETPKPQELLTCPTRGIHGFLPAGLRAHRCKGRPSHKTP